MPNVETLHLLIFPNKEKVLQHEDYQVEDIAKQLP